MSDPCRRSIYIKGAKLPNQLFDCFDIGKVDRLAFPLCSRQGILHQFIQRIVQRANELVGCQFLLKAITRPKAIRRYFQNSRGVMPIPKHDILPQPELGKIARVNLIIADRRSLAKNASPLRGGPSARQRIERGDDSDGEQDANIR